MEYVICGCMNRVKLMSKGCHRSYCGGAVSCVFRLVCLCINCSSVFSSEGSSGVCKATSYGGTGIVGSGFRRDINGVEEDALENVVELEGLVRRASAWNLVSSTSAVFKCVILTRDALDCPRRSIRKSVCFFGVASLAESGPPSDPIELDSCVSELAQYGSLVSVGDGFSLPSLLPCVNGTTLGVRNLMLW